MSTIDLADRLNDLENEMAERNDRSVEEFRSRFPENVAAIDALRNVLRIIHENRANQPTAYKEFTTGTAIERAINDALDGRGV